MKKIILKKLTALQPANNFSHCNLNFKFEKLIFRKPTEWHMRALARYVQEHLLEIHTPDEIYPCQFRPTLLTLFFSETKKVYHN
jgi:hypothetical protein